MQSQFELKKKFILTINSHNNEIVSKKHQSYKTMQINPISLGLQLQNSVLQSELLATKINNFKPQSQIYKVAKRFYINNSMQQKKIHFSSQKMSSRQKKIKNRYDQQRKAKDSVRVLYKNLTTDQRPPIKRCIQIQSIGLPELANNYYNNQKSEKGHTISQNLKKTVDEFRMYIQKSKIKQIKSMISNSIASKKNMGAFINPTKNYTYDNNVKGQKQSKKVTCQEFSVRKPTVKKDYFVFGLKDRNNPQNKIEYYRDFMWKINYSNSLNVLTPDEILTPYKAYIGPGNNYYLVKSILKRRSWWLILQKSQNSENFNFIWTQLKQNTFFKLQKKSNYQIQNCQDVSSFVTLVRQDSQIKKQTNCNSNQQDLYKKIFSKADLFNWLNHQTKNQKWQQKITQLTYVKRLPLYQKKTIKNIDNSSKLKIHNHLESNFFIGNKKALFYNMRRYLSLKNIDPFTILPLTFHISKGTEDPEFKLFKKYYEQTQRNKSQKGLRNIWIVKPGENTNRGNGISVAFSLDDIIIRLKGRQKNSDGKLRTFIIQKYIEKPLLYNKRKFDIRHYMLITCINGIFKGYWYQQGYIRTSSIQFTLKNSKDPFIHLTNDAVQKNGANYGKFQKGNKLSYQEFQRYIEQNYKNKSVNFFDNILPQMKQIATQSIKSTYSILDQNKKQHNFELLGLDFMIDQDFKPWLIEVNTNPCLELSCSLLQKIIPQLIQNVFRICIDPLFPPPQNWQMGKKIYLGQNPLVQNKFQIIFDQYDHGKQIVDLYKGSSFFDQKMGKIQEDNQVFQDNGDQDWQDKK